MVEIDQVFVHNLPYIGVDNMIDTKVAMVDIKTNRIVTYQDLEHYGSRLARYLKSEKQINVGDAVAIIAQDGIDSHLAVGSCLQVGAAVFTLDWCANSGAQLLAICKTYKPKLIIHDTGRANVVNELVRKIPISTMVIGDDVSDYRKLIEFGEPLGE